MTRFAVLGEHRSDAETIVVLMKRLLHDDRASIRLKGYNGCSQLRRKGAKQIRLFANLGANRFVVCHDADGPDPAPAHEKVRREVVEPSGVQESCCILIPVEELEAWIIADERAISQTIPTFASPAVSNPEGQNDPKEWIIRQSKQNRSRPLYVPSMHNARVAKYLDLDRVAEKCPSFKPLVAFLSC